MSDILATAIRAKDHPEEATERIQCKNLTMYVCGLLQGANNTSIPPVNIEYVGGNVIKLICGDSEYRVVIMSVRK